MDYNPLDEYGVQASGNAIQTCGPHTGHFVMSIAYCDSAETAAFLANRPEREALVAVVREMIFGEGTDASLQRVIDLCNEAKRRFGIERPSA